MEYPRGAGPGRGMDTVMDDITVGWRNKSEKYVHWILGSRGSFPSYLTLSRETSQENLTIKVSIWEMLIICADLVSVCVLLEMMEEVRLNKHCTFIEEQRWGL